MQKQIPEHQYTKWCSFMSNIQFKTSFEKRKQARSCPDNINATPCINKIKRNNSPHFATNLKQNFCETATFYYSPYVQKCL